MRGCGGRRNVGAAGSVGCGGVRSDGDGADLDMDDDGDKLTTTSGRRDGVGIRKVYYISDARWLRHLQTLYSTRTIMDVVRPRPRRCPQR